MVLCTFWLCSSWNTEKALFSTGSAADSHTCLEIRKKGQEKGNWEFVAPLHNVIAPWEPKAAEITSCKCAPLALESRGTRQSTVAVITENLNKKSTRASTACLLSPCVKGKILHLLNSASTTWQHFLPRRAVNSLVRVLNWMALLSNCLKSTECHCNTNRKGM